MSRAMRLLPDDILQMVLEDRKPDAAMAVRQRFGVGLQEARDVVWAAEEELGLMQDADCTVCHATGRIRVRKADYDPRQRYRVERENTKPRCARCHGHRFLPTPHVVTVEGTEQRAYVACPACQPATLRRVEPAESPAP